VTLKSMLRTTFDSEVSVIGSIQVKTRTLTHGFTYQLGNRSINFLQDWFSEFGAVFGDECHGLKSKSLTTIMDKCTEAEYRFGTTGTRRFTNT
jgi:superfamily II DNA or RNA helicase